MIRREIIVVTRTIRRKSTGQLVELSRGRIGQGRAWVEICFRGEEIDPALRAKVGYNTRLTFFRKSEAGQNWVEVIARQAIDATKEAVTHVSQSIFYGMARWACAILNSTRIVLIDGERVVMPPRLVWWNVYWRADDGDHFMDRAESCRERDACVLVAQLDSMLDCMYARPIVRVPDSELQ